jgi:hypothetical protein
MIRPVVSLSIVSALLVSIGGCASAPRDVVTTVPAANYAQTFEAAKATLRDYRFVIERVDARAGVITTQAKGTAGLITPWDKEQTTTRQELEELINQEVRTVRVEFIPLGTPERDPVINARKATLTPADQANADLIDLRDLGQDLQCRVVVAVDRLHRPGRLLSTKTIRGTRNYEDPDLNQRGIAPLSAESLGRDENLEKRLTAEIQKRAQNVSEIPATSASPAPVASPAPASSAPVQSSPASVGTQPGFEPLRIEPAGGSR